MTLRLVHALDRAERTGPEVRPSARVSTVIAKQLGADPSQIRRMIDAGDLEAHRLGICGIRVYLDSVAAWQAANAVKAKKAKGRKAPQPLPAPTRAAQAAHRQAVASLQSMGLVPASRR
jgi:excisionase family DNA binding protein